MGAGGIVARVRAAELCSAGQPRAAVPTWVSSGSRYTSSTLRALSGQECPLHTNAAASEDEFQAELDLARGEGSVGLHEILGLLVVSGVRNAVDVGEYWVKVVASVLRPSDVMVTRWLSWLKRLKESAVNSRR